MTNSLPSEIEALLSTVAPAGLGPGPRAGVTSAPRLRAAVEALTTDGLPDRQRELLTALVLLWHDHLEETHGIVQRIEDADGSLLHAIMHRREPDYWNAKYWFRRAGRHASGRLIADQLDRFAAADWPNGLKRRLLPAGVWDPLAFADFCEVLASAPSGDPAVEIAIRIQRVEFLAVLQLLCAA